MNNFLLCDTEETLNKALEVLGSSSRVVLDCEGQNLGKRGGKLSLISLRTTSSAGSQTFLIDTLRLVDSKLRPLFNIIESPETIKIVFDGRMDFSELYHSRGVSITGVLDLQLADISSRRLRGESEDRQLQRLSPYLRPGEVASMRHCYIQVQKLGGLGGCLNEHCVKASMDSFVSHSLWLERPIPKEQLRYAAGDVYAIEALLENFKTRNYIDENFLLDQSQRYISLWKDGRPECSDEFRNHGLLPLDILDHSIAFNEARLVCIGCRRTLPARCYSRAARQTVLKKRRCWVCRAVHVKKNQEAQYCSDFDDHVSDDEPVGGPDLENDYDWD